MSALNNLKLSAVKRPTALPAIQQRRNKLSNKLWEQIQLAKAQQTGATFSTKRFKTVRDITGATKTVELQKRVRQWWFVADSGKLCLNVKYGTKVLELQKNKPSVELNTPADLINTLEIIKGAVEAGELDSQIEFASGAVRARFTK
ncbi:hypothetical protein GQ367_08490 [Polynucleobacter sp. MWH-CaK5]|uniref:DUF6641 family protein n=1 Tax=Polynucleobacter sp. MWH-CaK5 TaxID=2689107 RepID=UPI001BFE04B0|nr:DUF6641 family protein [Polynucleobacter sp. MWH-CaK5]QWD88899.1 hypothetical protein GQ367_08490 [Polynucleobacter sp. MWH-CaK5]